MFRNEKLEAKVGLFIGVGIFLMFMIVFSVSDFYVFKKGYNIKVVFDFVNGITENAPIRFAGVHVGEVKTMRVFHDETTAKTRVELDAWIKGDVQVEEDAVARINTLGLLGEQYLEISPGLSKEFLKDGDIVLGRNPINVGEQMENVGRLIESLSKTFQHVERGEGTLGKLLTDDALYNDLAVVAARLKNGEGTIGKLLVEEKIYNDLEGFVGDIKQNPWKLLSKPSKSEKKSDKEKERGTAVSPR